MFGNNKKELEDDGGYFADLSQPALEEEVETKEERRARKEKEAENLRESLYFISLFAFVAVQLYYILKLIVAIFSSFPTIPTNQSSTQPSYTESHHNRKAVDPVWFQQAERVANESPLPFKPQTPTVHFNNL